MSYLDEINAALEVGDILNALNLAKQNEAAHGDEADFYTARAMICIRAGQDEAACKLLAAGVNRFPGDAEMWMNFAWLNSRLGNTAYAIDLYVRAKTITTDAALQAQIEAGIAAIEPPPAKRERAAPLCIGTIRPQDLLLQRFARGNSHSDLAFLFRRVEFGAEADEAKASLAQAAQSGVPIAEMEALARCAPHQGAQLLGILRKQVPEESR